MQGRDYPIVLATKLETLIRGNPIYYSHFNFADYTNIDRLNHCSNNYNTNNTTCNYHVNKI